uniref:Uncharacterized conserved protein, DUF433 family n=1 Tax=Candidatus Kentrum sp. MB TaxID=2138164 RepID=A0A450XRI3_9GAMM|nr:MAG: Uncharacterized conserved protein, DUF433 family [Candidatus Kentron sp. MB]
MHHQRIRIDPKIMFGKPVIKGTRVTVESIRRKIDAGMTDEQLLRHHPHLTIEDIQAAIEFGASPSMEKEAEFALEACS